MSMTDEPRLWTRLVAALHGEIPAATLEAYRHAGAGAYELLDRSELRRAELTIEHADAWSTDPATKAFRLCTWNAFTLQLLGDELLDADYRVNPATVGFVPPVTAQQALAFYAPVEGWLSRANQASSNPAYRLDVQVPAELPEWVEVEPCPREHLQAMLSACRRLRRHTEVAFGELERSAGAERSAELGRFRQRLAVVTTAADYADRLYQPDAAQEQHERAEDSVHRAIEAAYQLGQLLAMPELLARPDGTTQPAGSHGRLPRPGEAGFDPWCLTDPATRPGWQQDRRAVRAIRLLWESDPSPDRTVAIQDQIDAALARGDIAVARAYGQQVGPYFCCPWSSIFLVKRPVRIGGRRLRPMQQFTFDVSAEGLAEGERFRREILLGPFHPTDDVDYCDPVGEGHG
jgi:hypothetical protein